MKTRISQQAAYVTSLCALFAVSAVRADQEGLDDAHENAAKRSAAVRVAPVASSKYWIGVHAQPIDEALKAQLGLQERLIVHHVLPDSPAARAGLQTHDILLKFGDQEIATLEDLIQAVDQQGTKAAELRVLRAGKEMTLHVTAVDRPGDEQLNALLPPFNPEELRARLGEAFRMGKNADGTVIWRALGPGVMGRHGEMLKVAAEAGVFPNGLAVSVTKENDQPAKITAKKDGKTYETTEDQLEVLPEEIRGPVQRLLGAPKLTVWGFGPDGSPRLLTEDVRKHAEAVRRQVEESVEKARGEADKAEAEARQSLRHRIEIRRVDGDGLEALRKEVQALRKDIQQLIEAKKDGSKEP